MTTRPHFVSDARGQSLLEFAIVLPLLLVLVLGVIEVGYALLDQHVLTKLAREGSNLISRDTSLEDAALVMKTMSSAPVNFDIRRILELLRNEVARIGGGHLLGLLD